jgi:heme/copper-type cytochrome/quinol oxidase subunit 4
MHMKFLRRKRANDTVEWVVTVVLVVAVVGSMIYSIANTANTQGSGTEAWIGNIPAPTTP